MGVGRRPRKAKAAAPARATRSRGGAGARAGGDWEADDVELFHAQRDRRMRKGAAPLKLIGDDDDDGDDLDASSSEEVVMSSDEDSSDGDDDDESSSPEDSEDVDDAENDDAETRERTRHSKRLGSRKLLSKLESQEALLGGKLNASKGERYSDSDDSGSSGDDDSSSGGSDEEDERWGRNKKTYYAGDGRDEEVLEEEAAEAKRLQSKAAARFRNADFGFDDDDDDDDDDDLGAGGARAGEDGPTRMPGAVGALGSGLSDEERDAIIAGDAPQLVALLSDLEHSLSQIDGVIKPAMEAAFGADEGKEGKGGKEGVGQEGLSFLACKNQMLLLYSTHIVLFLLMKAEGVSVRNHPILARLLELRTFIEKVRPIEKRMGYQINKLLRTSGEEGEAAGEGAAAGKEGPDPLRFGPNPGALVAARGSAVDAAAMPGDAAYQPPRIAPVAYDGDAGEDGERREAAALRQKVHARRKALRNEYVQHLARDVLEAPEEIGTDGTNVGGGVGGSDGFIARERARQERRAAEEEDLFSRVPLTKQERKRRAAAERSVFTGAGASSILDDLDIGTFTPRARAHPAPRNAQARTPLLTLRSSLFPFPFALCPSSLCFQISAMRWMRMTMRIPCAGPSVIPRPPFPKRSSALSMRIWRRTMTTCQTAARTNSMPKRRNAAMPRRPR